MRTPKFYLAAAVLPLAGCAEAPPPYVGGLTPTEVYAKLGPYVDDDRICSTSVVGDPALADDPRLSAKEQPKAGRILIRQIEFQRPNAYPIVVFFRKQKGRWIAYEQDDLTMHYKDVRALR